MGFRFNTLSDSSTSKFAFVHGIDLREFLMSLLDFANGCQNPKKSHIKS